MKSTVNKPLETVAAKPYPKLMKSGDLIVLFSQVRHGMVIHNGEIQITTWLPGYSSTAWDMTNFTDFKGAVTLEND